MRTAHFRDDWRRTGAGTVLALVGPVVATLLTVHLSWLMGHGEFSLFVAVVAVTSAFGTGPATLAAASSIVLLQTVVDTGRSAEPGRSELIAAVSLLFVAAVVSQLVDRARRARARFEEMNVSLASNELLLRQLVDEATGSRESLEIALGAGRMVAWEFTPETGLSFSPGFAAIHGRSADGIDRPDVYRQLIHPDDRARVSEELIKTMRDPASSDFLVRYRIIRADGSERWLEDRGRIERGPDGRVARSFGVAVDVSEQLESDRRLVEAERRYRTLVERLPLTVYATNPYDGAAIYFSPQVLELTGYTADEILARGGLGFWRSLILEEDREQSVTAFEGFIEEQEQTYSREYRIRHRDGRIVWVSSAAQFIAGGDGKPVQVQGFLLDITKQREAVADLAEAEARYRTLVEQLPLVTYITDLESSDVVYMSPQVEAVSGFTPAEVAAGGRGFWIKRIHPDDAAAAASYKAWLARKELGSSTRASRYRVQHKNGHWVWVTTAAQMVETPDGRALIQGFILDVSEQVAAEESFRTVFQSSPLGIMVGELDKTAASRRILQVNEEFCRLIGRSSDELVGHSIIPFIHPDDKDANTSYLKELVAGERDSFSTEWRYVHPDGTEVLVRGTTALMGWTSEGTARAVMMTEDVTEERRVQQERAELERRYRTLIEQLPLVTYMNMPDRTLGFMSPQLADIVGFSGDELSSDDPAKPSFIDLIHPDDWQRVDPVVVQALAAGKPFHVEYRVRTKDGRWVWLRDEQVTITGDDGEPLYSLGFLIDISHAKEVEGELAAALEDARSARLLAERTLAEIDTLIQTSAVALALLDRDGRYVRVSDSLAELNGIPAEEHVGRHFSEVVPPQAANKISAALEQAAKGEPFTETDEQERGGAKRHVHVGYYPVRTSAGEVIGFSVAILDLTEQRALEQRIQQSHQLESLGRLAGGIAHDFNNILTSVQISADMILDQVHDGSVRAEAEAARNAAVHGAGLVKQLLAFGRQQVMQPRPIDLNQTLLDLEGMLGKLAAAEEIEVVYELDAAGPWIVADPSQIGQVALNLTVNARDAMPDGGRLTIRTRVVEADERGTRRVELIVADNGVGMSQQVQARLFEPFFTTKEEGSGTGLGLATVYGIVSQTDGEITVESAEGAGAIFTINWPAAACRDETATPAEPAEPAELTAATKPVILLAEDEDGVRMLVSSLLARRGFSVIEAGDGAHALELADEHPEIGLLLTDVRMPRIGGGELAERLREHRPQLPVIFISGQSDDERVRHRLGEERTAFLPKPFGADEIEQAIAAVIAENGSSG